MTLAALLTVAILAGGPAPLPGDPGTATGDIPDNQVFVTFKSRTAHWSMKVPEGWAQKGAGANVTFRDKNNIVRVVVARGPVPSLARVRRDSTGLHITSGPTAVRVSGAPAVKLTYSTVSAPSPVTGKRVTLGIDRYYLWHAGSVAIVDLGTPRGVDNVDAYRLMVKSFQWR